jgi:type II secretory pathway pseudopilin PulG
MQSRQRNEAGESLVELLVTIAIIGLTIALLVGVLANSIAASSTHRQHATADTIARDVAEALKERRVPDSWVASGNYPPSTWSSVNTSGYQVSVPPASCWNGDTPATWVSCSVPAAAARGLQLITVTVTSNSRGEQEKISILKRKN